MNAAKRVVTIGVSLLLLGCGGGGGGENLPATVDASGVVLLDGTPVEGASVVFVPVAPGTYPAFASTDSRGGFSLKAFEAKTGAVPGSYQVQLSKTVEIKAGGGPAPAPAGEDAEHAANDPSAGLQWKNSLPAKYASSATSEIKIDIPENGRSDIKIELVSKP